MYPYSNIYLIKEINKLNNIIIDNQNKNNNEINNLNNIINELQNNKIVYETRILILENFIYNNIINISHNNNNNNNYKINNTQLFFKVWRNVVIRNEILKHRDLHKVVIFSSEQLISYPYKEYVVKLEYRSPELIVAGSIPSNVRELKIFNGKIELGSIPFGVTSLVFGKNFNQALIPHMIPESVNSIEFEIQSQFDQPIVPNTFPSSVKTISFGYYFNQPIFQGTFNEGLETLKLGHSFNFEIPINSIPSTVKSLSIMCDNYNHLINYESVKKVKQINLNCDYPLPIDIRLISKIKMKLR